MAARQAMGASALEPGDPRSIRRTWKQQKNTRTARICAACGTAPSEERIGIDFDACAWRATGDAMQLRCADRPTCAKGIVETASPSMKRMHEPTRMRGQREAGPPGSMCRTTRWPWYRSISAPIPET